MKLKALAQRVYQEQKAYKEADLLLRNIDEIRGLKVTDVGPGIVNTVLAIRKPSLIFGKNAAPLDDLDKLHQIMITRIRVNQVSLVLSTNQGTPDVFSRNLQTYSAQYGAMINGGFFAINGFYGLKDNYPVGLHRLNFNSSTHSVKDVIVGKLDTTHHYFEHEPKELSRPFEGYERHPEIDSQLCLKTQTPHSVSSEYGFFRINRDGSADIERLSFFQERDDAVFKAYIDSANYLLSAGPVLVWNNQVTFTEEKLQEPRYQFKTVYDRFGSHPGSVPPGTFYHADQCNPRSAIGFNPKGELLMVTVKGEEDPRKRDGMTLPQFALLMKALGVEKALNLDGGYSACQGVFNNDKMLTPLFSKKSGRETIIPCAILAKQQTAAAEPDCTKQPEARPVVDRRGIKMRKFLLSSGSDSE